MRLLIERDNGDVQEFGSVVNEDPIKARNLLADAYFLCEAALSETSPVEFLYTEQVIRETLLHLQASGDKQVRSYVITRTLDQYISKTPRASLITEAFQRGGPIALIGVFYATIDAHRNQRHKRALNYLLSHEVSRRELLSRTRTFPCHASISAWLIRILEKLDPSAQGLAHVLQELGTSPLIKFFFQRIRGTSPTWGSNGNLMNIGAHLIPLLESDPTAALLALEAIGFLRSTSDHMYLDNCISDLLKDHLGGSPWFIEAVKAVCHVFPKYPAHMPELYPIECELLLPQFTAVIKRLHSQPEVLSHLNPIQLTQVAEASLSASNFRGQQWRELSVSVALQATQCLAASDQQTILHARVKIRKANLKYLYDGTVSGVHDWTTLPDSLPPRDRRSWTVLAEAAITKARDCITVNTLSLADQYLQGCQWGQGPLQSPIETWQKEQVELARARILRFEGRFPEALAILLGLHGQTNAIMIQKGIVFTELNDFEQARSQLSSASATSPPALRSKRLGLANVNLLEVVSIVLSGSPPDWQLLQVSQMLYQDMSVLGKQPTFFGKIDHLSALIGLAMTKHLGDHVDAAIESWGEALAASKAFLPEGYTDMIISYSLSELYLRKGAYKQSSLLNDQAAALFTRTGCQYHFIGLGTAWPNLLATRFKDHRRLPVIPPRSY